MIEKGISNLGDIFENHSFMTFDQLQKKYNILQKTHYQYIQLKKAIKSSVVVKTT